MRTLLHILLILFSLSGFSQGSEETFNVKKTNEPAETTKTIALPEYPVKLQFNNYTLNWGELKLTDKDTISKKALQMGYSLSLTLRNYSCSISYFTMEFIIDGLGVKYSSNRPYLTNAMKKKLKTLQPGDRIVIDNIKNNCVNRNLPPVSQQNNNNDAPIITLPLTESFRFIVTE